MNRVSVLSCLSALALPVGLLLSACTVTTDGGKPGDTEGPKESAPQDSSGIDCTSMKDEPPMDPETAGEVVKVVLTNGRDVPVYYRPLTNPDWYGCGSGGWRVDGAPISGHSPPACEGLLAGEPGLPLCGPPGYEELGAGETVEFDWDRRVIGSAPVLPGCSNTADGPFETCSRAHLVENGPHELSVSIGLDRDENTGIPSSYLPTVVVPFTLPTETVNVVVAP